MLPLRKLCLAVVMLSALPVAASQTQTAPTSLAVGTSVRVAPQTREAFGESFSHVRTVRDPLHAPVIEAPESIPAGEWFQVSVTVGRDRPHPSRVDDHIRSIALYKGDVEIARAQLHPVHSLPRVTFWVSLLETATLRALAVPSDAAAYESSHIVEVVD